MGNQSAKENLELTNEEASRANLLQSSLITALSKDPGSLRKITSSPQIQVSELLDHVTSVLPEPIQFPSAPRDNLGSVQIPLAAKNKKGKLPAWSRKKRRMHASLATQWQTALEAGKACGLEKRPADEKGMGVFTTKPFCRHEFICEYVGERLTKQQGLDREAFYGSQDACYMFYLGPPGWIDATSDAYKDHIGRYMNHGKKKFNVIPKPCRERKRLFFVASRDIEIGEELLYDYNDKSKESLKHNPWLRK